MQKSTLIILYITLLVYIQECMTLKCRTGNQRMDDQFQKIVQMCRKRHLGHKYENENSSVDESNSENLSNSDEDIFDRKFFVKNSNRNSARQRKEEQNRSYRNMDWSGKRSMQSYLSNYTDENTKDTYGYNRRININRHAYNNQDRVKDVTEGHSFYSENYNTSEDACIIQCFLNELNVVDKRGFPERQAVVQLMTENIHDPELQDFVEESITECFYFLHSDARKEKCSYSQNLLRCLRDKGKERCEDWND